MLNLRTSSSAIASVALDDILPHSTFAGHCPSSCVSVELMRRTDEFNFLNYLANQITCLAEVRLQTGTVPELVCYFFISRVISRGIVILHFSCRHTWVEQSNGRNKLDTTACERDPFLLKNFCLERACVRLQLSNRRCSASVALSFNCFLLDRLS